MVRRTLLTPSNQNDLAGEIADGRIGVVSGNLHIRLLVKSTESLGAGLWVEGKLAACFV